MSLMILRRFNRFLRKSGTVSARLRYCLTVKGKGRWFLKRMQPQKTNYVNRERDTGDAIASIHVSFKELTCLKNRRCEFCRSCVLLGDSSGTHKLSRRNADNPFEMKAKVALIREARAERNLRQAEPAVCPQEILCPFNAPRDYILMRR